MSGVVVLTGGVGGAKLVDGLVRVAGPNAVTAIVNTGDDFRHHGLHISPDIDTLIYTLSGLADPEKGWGRVNESWSFMAALRELGAEDWFQLGDRDLAIHVLRSAAMAAGATLSEVTADLTRRFGISATILPMSDEPVPTMIESEEGELSFQQYFVARRCEPVVRAIRHGGAERASPAPAIEAALADAQTILIAPSNPFLSIAPILAIPALQAALRQRRVPCVAVSPLIGSRAVKGPTAKLMVELGLPTSNEAIADFYHGLVDGVLIDKGDRLAAPDLAVAGCATLMSCPEDRDRVATHVLALARSISL